MKIHDTSVRIDIASGSKPDRVNFQDNCFRYSCYEWDYKCLLKCEGPNWEYAMLLAESATTLAAFNPYFTGPGYYSVSNNSARSSYCRNQCDVDYASNGYNKGLCKYYCGILAYDDANIRYDIASGDKTESHGWYPANRCESYKKSGWGGCYSWDYQCLDSCMASDWEYGTSLLEKKDLQALTLPSFDAYAMGSGYYTSANINARYQKCNEQCDADYKMSPFVKSNCKFYCTNMKFDDNQIKFDINFGTKEDSNGWYPSNRCETWKKNGWWYYGNGEYSGGCYEWDYQCLNSCLKSLGISWQYAPSLAEKDQAELLSLTLASTGSSKFDKTAVNNADYYSEENNTARKALCISKCDNDYDCKWYCG